MEPLPVFPLWARVLMPLALLWLGFSAIGCLVVAVSAVMEGGGIPALPMAGLGLFFLYLTWRSWPVMGSMRFRARLSGRDLHYRRNAAADVVVVPVDLLEVSLSEAMQLISVHVVEPRQRLFMVDNSSSFGARLARRIVELQEAGKK